MVIRTILGMKTSLILMTLTTLIIMIIIAINGATIHFGTAVTTAEQLKTYTDSGGFFTLQYSVSIHSA